MHLNRLQSPFWEATLLIKLLYCQEPIRDGSVESFLGDAHRCRDGEKDKVREQAHFSLGKKNVKINKFIPTYFSTVKQ